QSNNPPDAFGRIRYAGREIRPAPRAVGRLRPRAHPAARGRGGAVRAAAHRRARPPRLPPEPRHAVPDPACHGALRLPAVPAGAPRPHRKAAVPCDAEGPARPRPGAAVPGRARAARGSGRPGTRRRAHVLTPGLQPAAVVAARVTAPVTKPQQTRTILRA